jgi:hypothetical protein
MTDQGGWPTSGIGQSQGNEGGKSPYTSVYGDLGAARAVRDALDVARRMPPPGGPPEPLTFRVWWADQTLSTYTGITKSSREGDYLFLATYNRNWIVNLARVSSVTMYADGED